MKTLAILVGAGRGERMGAGRPKAFVPLAGRALLAHAAAPFDACRAVDAILAVVPEPLVGEGRAVLAPVAKLIGVVAGGARRQDSVRAGLTAAPGAWDVVLVHDAARPFASEALIAAVARAAAEHGAAVPVAPVVDTIKRVEGGEVRGTLERSALAAAQTPQGFRAALLAEAYERAFADGAVLTDEAMAVERLGRRVVAVPGEAANRKLTTAEDLAWAEQRLRGRVEARA